MPGCATALMKIGNDRRRVQAAPQQLQRLREAVVDLHAARNREVEVLVHQPCVAQLERDRLRR